MSFRNKAKRLGELNALYKTDTLPIAAFRSSQALKDEIRRIMGDRRAENWDFCGLKTCGAIISLCFKRSLNLSVSESDNCGCLQCA